MLGSTHDLRIDHPDAVNILGVTAEQGGACSACHTAHEFARELKPNETDPTGQCVTCHTPDGLAAGHVLTGPNHPVVACTSCHDPHVTQFGNYLTEQPWQRCTACHTDYQLVRGGPHDVAGGSPVWPEKSLNQQDMCLACHQPHGTPQSGLFRAGLAPAEYPPDSSCLACHSDVRSNETAPLAFLHTRDGSSVTDSHAVSMYETPDGKRRIVCRTCHNPHAGVSASANLLRIAPLGDSEDLCLNCHPKRINIRTIGHAEGSLREAGWASDSCRPCHVVHGPMASVERNLMWPKSLTQAAGTSESTEVSEVHCRACHRANGPVAPPAIATHPAKEMFNPNPPDMVGYLPLFNDAGEVDPSGHMTCRTCHLTHGRSEPAPIPPGMENLASREMRARQWHVRTFVPNNLCSTCHGFDALRRFMYFHDAARRSGPIEGG